MKIIILLFLLLLSFISCDNFAVLVAGSNTWTNYKHQANIFHNYQILKERGIKQENIIVFAYDDIAYNSKNPFPGKIFNAPNGKDVYEGVVIDYIGKDVTPENFIAAITGDNESIRAKDERTTKKVPTSTEKDNVYIYFSDHGSDSLIAFPSKYLYADELIAALLTMHEKKMYKELVFFLDAVHAGSMFENILPSDISIYTTYPGKLKGSTFSEYCGQDSIVNGTLIGPCLGDEFSCRFMEDIDSRPGDLLKNYSIQEQYEYLVRIVKGSYVQQYGDLEIAKKSIYEFVNSQTKKIIKTVENIFGFNFPHNELRNSFQKKTTKINNENYRLEYFRLQSELNNNLETENEYYEEIEEEGNVIKIFELFKKWFNLPERDYSDKINYDCYRKVIKSYEDKCGMFIDRDFKFMNHIANFCTQGICPKEADRAFEAICK